MKRVSSRGSNNDSDVTVSTSFGSAGDIHPLDLQFADVWILKYYNTLEST